MIMKKIVKVQYEGVWIMKTTIKFLMIIGLLPFFTFANTLEQPLDEEAQNFLEAITKHQPLFGAKQWRIGLKPIELDDVYIQAKQADELNDVFIGALIKQIHDYDELDIAPREELKHIINDQRDNNYNPIHQILAKNIAIDVLLIPSIQKQTPTEAKIRWKAVKADGSKSLAYTNWLSFTINNNSLGNALPIRQAMQKLSKDIQKQSLPIKALIPHVIHYQDTHHQTSLSHYIMQQMTTYLSQALHNSLTGQALQIIDPETLRQTPQTRGISVTESQMDDFSQIQDKEYFIVKGNYWAHKESIEVQIQFKNPQNQIISWHGFIERQTLPSHISVVPEEVHYNDIATLGPINIALTTNKGSNPVFKIGNRLELKISTSHNAYIYCYYHQNDGKTLQIYPHPLLYTNNYLQKNTLEIIPGKKATFTVGHPVGTEGITCYATNKDITQQLPPELQATGEYIPKNIAKTIHNIFHNIHNVQISQAGIPIMVVE